MKQKLLSRGSKIAYRISMAVIGVAIIFVLWIGYLLFQPINVLEVEVPIPATPTEVKAGDTVNLNFDYCKHRQYDSHIKIDFLGEYIIPSLSTTRSFAVGCHSENLAISIPAASPEGIYTIRLQIDYQVSLLRKEHYVFDSVEIKVINNEAHDTIQIGESQERTERERVKPE